jgi:hypothetical protein
MDRRQRTLRMPFSPPLEHRPAVRVTNRTLLVIGALLILAGPVPLVLDILFGPEGGNHLGLGLLVWLCWLAGGALLVAGGIGSLVGRLRRDP